MPNPSMLLLKYDLTIDSYERLLTDQGNRCAICLRFFNTAPANLVPHVDHDHKTGIVRGLLCSTCNTGLGLFRDSVSNLASAILYLQDAERKEEQASRFTKRRYS